MALTMRSLSILALVVCLLVPASAALGQETRAEEIAAKQKEKAAKLHPYEPLGFEKIMDRLEQGFVSPPSGFYPAFGSVYQGGGFAAGLGYRYFDKRDAVWDVHGLYSVKSYKKLEFAHRGPWDGEGTFAYEGKLGWIDAPQVAFYGLGMDDINRLGRTNYHVTWFYTAFSGVVRPTWWTRLRGDLGYDAFDTKEGSGKHPSIEEIYSPSMVPGLGSSPSYIRTEGEAAIDWRPSAGYATRGGYYGVTLVNLSDTDDTFSFKRLDAEAIQHLPLLHGNWVLSGRVRMQSILDDDDAVPYFLMPFLGSGTTLRGYPTGFFRDRHSILTSAEFRWVPNRLAFDMAIFYDAGKVASDRSDLDFDDLKSNWGIGARFHTPRATFLRIEAAKPKQDKWRLVVSTGAAF